MVENNGDIDVNDDSDHDPDYQEETVNSSSSEEEEIVRKAQAEPGMSEKGEPVKGKRALPARERAMSETRVYLEPPIERADGDTDKDSDDSDEPTGLVCHLPRRILREHAEKRRRRRAVTNQATLEADSDDEDDDGDVQQPVDPGRWFKKDPELLGSRVPAFVPKPLPDADRQKVLDDLSTAYDYYKLFQPDSFAKEVNFVKANQNIIDQM